MNMKKVMIAAALLMNGMIFQSCDNSAVAPEADTRSNEAAARRGGRSYNTHLSGDEEVRPANLGPVITNATGQANFKLSKDGTQLHYKLIVANIGSVRFAHLHLAPKGENGQVVVTLFHPMPAVMSPQGVIAEGVITSASLSGPLAGMQLSDLIAAIEAGNIYVNVHSIKYPGGELRGQL
jgi:hypothetical protein